LISLISKNSKPLHINNESLRNWKTVPTEVKIRYTIYHLDITAYRFLWWNYINVINAYSKITGVPDVAPKDENVANSKIEAIVDIITQPIHEFDGKASISETQNEPEIKLYGDAPTKHKILTLRYLLFIYSK